MLGVIKKPEDIFSELTEDFKNAFGNDLVAIALHGSAASGHYVAGKSDINFLVILTEAGLNDLEQGIPVMARWQKKRVSCLLMTESYIRSSIDSYPVEFMNMKISHIMVFGPDILADLNFDAEHLRLQLERELKGKVFHLQQGFLESDGKDKALKQLIKLSISHFVPHFKALLYLRDCKIPQARREVVEALAHAYPVNASVFQQCLDIREGKGKFASGEIKKLFKSYREEIARLASLIDCMKFPEQCKDNK